MSTNLIRSNFAAVAFKHETTGGTDVIAGSPGADDWIGADCEVQFNPDVIEIDEYTGSMDRAASIIGGLKPQLRLRMPIRGSGAAATAPPFGKLLQCCTMALTATGAAVGAPTAATAGTTITVTAATPFGTTAQQYRGMPLVITGVSPGTTGIMDYTAGRVITVGDTRVLMTTSSLLQVPVNNLYAPSSDESAYKTGTLYLYKDGILWAFVGCSGTYSIEINTAGLAFITFELRAVFGAKSAVSLPAGAATAAAARALIVPPRLVAGKVQLNKAAAQIKTLTWNAGVETILPDDPEGADGYGPALAVSRDVTGSLNPYINTTTAVGLMDNFRAGTSMTLMAILGSTAGNRFLFSSPAVKNVAMDPGDRGGLAEHGMNFQADGADSSLFVCAF
jgi:hypothetical protein